MRLGVQSAWSGAVWYFLRHLCRAGGGGRELEVQPLEEEERQGRVRRSWCGVLMCIFYEDFLLGDVVVG